MTVAEMPVLSTVRCPWCGKRQPQDVEVGAWTSGKCVNCRGLYRLRV